MKCPNKVPPDGGYGWVVTFAYALNNVVLLPLISQFGLVFQEAFAETGLSATQGSLVITLNHGIGMLLSFFSGPVLKRFGYRKVAIFGAIAVSLGLIITSFGTSFWIFIISYSIINSMGIAAVMAAFSLAINSFFKEKRSRAIGIGMSITGLGTIYTPLLISLLIYLYGWRNAVLILGAISLHSLVAALLLRPVKWYLINPPKSEELVPLQDENVELINGSFALPSKDLNMIHPRIEELKSNGLSTPKSLSMKSLTNTSRTPIQSSFSQPDLRDVMKTKSPTPIYKWWESHEINLGSSVNIFREIPDKKNNEIKYKERPDKTDDEKLTNKYLRSVINFFDLTLLTDPIFVNILVGLSIASCVETMFSLLFPIIIKDMFKFETSESATMMAVIGLSDTLSRFVSPFIGEWCHKSPRVMYIANLVVVVFIRTMMLFTTSYTGMLFVSLGLGLTKGVRTVYMNVVIPSYVPLERLPFASGIQMLFNGIFIIATGPILGRLREDLGSYQVPIIVLNLVTLVTVVSWSAEFLYLRVKNKANPSGTEDEV